MSKKMSKDIWRDTNKKKIKVLILTLNNGKLKAKHTYVQRELSY